MKRPSVKLFSQTSLLYEWPDDISDQLFVAVWNWRQFLLERLGPFIEEIVPAYSSLAVYLKPSARIADFISLVDIATIEGNSVPHSSRLVTIPVCYEAPYGEDLAFVAGQCGLSATEVIERHCAPNYLLHFIGFLPGFPYLGGLDPGLHIARKSTPSKIVRQGSVAIGGQQTGIYPTDSPGGWHVIGRTPLRLFDPKQSSPALLKAGDRVRFKPVSERSFRSVRSKVEQGEYQLTTTAI